MGINAGFTVVKWGEKPVDKHGDRTVNQLWLSGVVAHMVGLFFCAMPQTVDTCTHVLLTPLRMLSTKFPQCNGIRVRLCIELFPYLCHLFTNHKVELD